jgi:hypothetical protein
MYPLTNSVSQVRRTKREGKEKFFKEEIAPSGGNEGIRTLDGVAPMVPFQGTDLNHSSTFPANNTIIETLERVKGIEPSS